MLKVKNLTKTFGNIDVIKGVDIQINKGDVVAIIGPSGAGKTTLLRCMNFLEKSDTGLMEFNADIYDMANITKKEIQAIHMKTGFVFQSFNLFRNKTCLQNVTEGLIVARKMSKELAANKGKELLNKVGLADKYSAYPDQLSGGQQQRVAIARALATDPEIIYFDEPTSALDPELTMDVLNVMKQLASEGMTMIVVTHELSFARNVSNRVILMENGLIVEENNSKDFFNKPQETRTQEFIRTLKKED